MTLPSRIQQSQPTPSTLTKKVPPWTMSQDGPHDAKPNGPAAAAPAAHTPSQPQKQQPTNWRSKLGVPEPVKRVFRKFPLETYAANELPATSPTQRDEHALWIWTTEEGAQRGDLSFNPSCLKWQAYLKFAGIPFHTIASNNHASPSGSLPFLLPAASTSAAKQPSPVPLSKLATWAQDHGSSSSIANTTSSSSREDLYTALLDHRIRRAWLYTLYLSPQNFSAVAKPRYIAPSSANALVNAAMAFQLQKAAREELLKINNGYADAGELLDEAKEAFAALETLLAGDEWFFGRAGPGVFDAGVFAYTHLLLDEGLGWVRTELGDVVRGCEGLVRHRERVLEVYFS